MIEIERAGMLYEKEIYLFKLSNEFLEVGILNSGGIIKYLKVNTPDGEKNIVLGIDDLDEYFRENNYSSAIIGRVANRIKHGKFKLNNTTYNISKNDGEHCNHGGIDGFDKKVLEYSINDDTLSLFLFSPDGEQGFGGNLKLELQYRLINNTFRIEFIAESDKDTVFAPTYHPYFNLGDHSDNIYDTMLKINSDVIAVLDKECFPTGELKITKDTPLDFSCFKRIGDAIFSDNEQVKLCSGLDHCYMAPNDYIASAYNKESKINLDLFSNLPGVQVYTSNDFDLKPEKSRFFKHCAFCLEPQFFPDAVNIDNFEQPTLLADTIKKYYIEYIISVKEEI